MKLPGRNLFPICTSALLFSLIFGHGTVPLQASVAGLNKEDSLYKALAQTADYNQKVRIYLSLAELVKTRSADSCDHFLQEAQKMFWQINSLPYLGRVYEIKGDLARQSNDFSNATRLYKLAVFSYDKNGQRTEQTRLLNYIGGAYAQAGNISEAFRYYLKAREFALEDKDLDMLARINNNLGRMYIVAENYRVGIEYYRRALAVFEKGTDSFKTATVYMNLGTAYFHSLKMDSSRTYVNKAISIFRAIKKKYYEGTSLQTYAFTLISEKKYPEALIYLNHVKKIAMEPGSGAELIESKLLLSDVLVFTGVTYCLMGEYLLARKYLLPGYHLSDSLGLLDRTKDALEYLNMAYEKTGQIDSSLYFHKLFKLTSDSLMKIQSINVVKLAEVQMDYEKEVKEKQTQLAYNNVLQKRNLIIFLGAGAILLALVLILILKLRIEKQKKKQAEIEKKQAELEKQTADIQLESQNKELTLNVMSLIRKNELILELSDRLIEIKELTGDERTGSEIVHLVNTMQKNTDGNVWEEFELRFKQVHNNFYEKLLGQYPDLTQSELKLCALLKLNLSNKEISELSGQRSATLEVARYRLRKKLGISNSQVNLVTFLSQI
jgi:tetratricopeptide (TPR) repeat protein